MDLLFTAVDNLPKNDSSFSSFCQNRGLFNIHFEKKFFYLKVKVGLKHTYVFLFYTIRTEILTMKSDFTLLVDIFFGIK